MRGNAVSRRVSGSSTKAGGRSSTSRQSMIVRLRFSIVNSISVSLSSAGAFDQLRLAVNLAGEVDNIRLDRAVGVVLLASAEVTHAGHVIEMPPESFAVVTTLDQENRPSAGELATIE